jgi:hypothetical protein
MKAQRASFHRGNGIDDHWTVLRENGAGGDEAWPDEAFVKEAELCRSAHVMSVVQLLRMRAVE